MVTSRVVRFRNRHYQDCIPAVDIAGQLSHNFSERAKAQVLDGAGATWSCQRSSHAAEPRRLVFPERISIVRSEDDAAHTLCVCSML